MVFLHGLTANSQVNWEEPGLAAAVASSGWQPILLDGRGHGASEKSVDPDDYGWARHGRDVIELLDHLRVSRCALVGYSLGAGAAAWVTPRDARVRAAVLAGMSPETLRPWATATVDEYVNQLLAPHGPGSEEGDEDLVGPFGSSVAVSIANIRALAEPALFPYKQVSVPVLVLNGLDDVEPEDLAAMIPGAVARSVPGNHLTAPSSAEFASELIGFLARAFAPTAQE